MNDYEWKKIVDHDESLPAIGDIVALCFSGVPEHQAYRRVQADEKEITYDQVFDPEYVNIFEIEATMKCINSFAKKHGYVWQQVSDSYISCEINPSHWTRWFEPPNS